MRAVDLLGVSIAGAVMVAIGLGVALTVQDDGLTTVGFIVAGIGGLAILLGLLAFAVYAGVKAARTD